MTMTEQNQHETVSKDINFHNFIPKYGYAVSLRSSVAVKNDRLVLLVLIIELRTLFYAIFHDLVR
jgi:hypothetical protein